MVPPSRLVRDRAAGVTASTVGGGSNFLGKVPYRTDVIQVSRISFMGEEKAPFALRSPPVKSPMLFGLRAVKGCSFGLFGLLQSFRYRT